MSNDKQKWFSYGAIRFSPEQVEWILENIIMFETGRWPKEPIERDLENPDSAYSTGSPPEEPTGTGDYFTKTYRVYSTGDKASFIKPTLMAAEITARMDRCGRDGQICERYYRGLPLPYDSDDIEARITKVKAYISGWVRKRISYEAWCRRKRR